MNKIPMSDETSFIDWMRYGCIHFRSVGAGSENELFYCDIDKKKLNAGLDYIYCVKFCKSREKDSRLF